MATRIFFFLEESLPELKELTKLGIFTEAEIKKIIRQREKMEYLIQSSARRPVDFIRYIDFEVDLYSEKKLRLVKTFGGQKFDWDRGLMNAFRIWGKLINAFSSDPNLWQKYCKFCLASSSYRKLSEVAARFIRRHPRDYRAWKNGAKLEFAHRANPASARQIFLRGVAFCSKSVEFWLAYLKFEIDYLNFCFHLEQNNTDFSFVKKKLPEIEPIEEENGLADLQLPKAGPFWEGALIKVVLNQALTSLSPQDQSQVFSGLQTSSSSSYQNPSNRFKQQFLMTLGKRGQKQKIHPKMKKLLQKLADDVGGDEDKLEIEIDTSEIDFKIVRKNIKNIVEGEDFDQMHELCRASPLLKEKIWAEFFEILIELRDPAFPDLLHPLTICLFDLKGKERISILKSLIHNFQTLSNVFQVVTTHMSKPSEAELQLFLELGAKFGAPTNWFENCYEKLVTFSPQSGSAWASYCNFLAKNNFGEKSGTVYYRALSALKNPTDFMREYNLLLNGFSKKQ